MRIDGMLWYGEIAEIDPEDCDTCPIRELCPDRKTVERERELRPTQPPAEA